MTTTLNLNAMASEIMLGGRLDPARHGVEYRKGKTVEDVKKALRRARNPRVGMAKVEVELSMFELYLRTQVFRAAAPATAAVAGQEAA